MTGQQAGKDSTTMGILQEYIIHLDCKVDGCTGDNNYQRQWVCMVYQNSAKHKERTGKGIIDRELQNFGTFKHIGGT